VKEHNGTEVWAYLGQKIVYLVINSFIQVLDEDITLTRFAESWVALRPHDAAARAGQRE
jgi:hypothetical protein